MAIGVVLEFHGATRAQYENTVKKVLKGRRKKLADWPVKGVLAHMAGPMPDGWRVVDVWQSEGGLKKFGTGVNAKHKKKGPARSRAKDFQIGTIYQGLIGSLSSLISQ